MINHYDNDDNYDDDEIDDLYSHYQIMTFSYVCCVLMIKISYTCICLFPQSMYFH